MSNTNESVTESGVFRVTINAPIDKVWAELTRTEMLLPFFFNTKCVTRPEGLGVGAPMRMRSNDDRYTGVTGTVLEWDPPNRYATSFKFTNYDDPECKVIHDLRAIDANTTEYTLTNENVPVGTKTAKQMQAGGKFITDNFKAIVETGKPTPMGRFALFMMGLFAPFAPAKTKSENWPL